MGRSKALIIYYSQRANTYHLTCTSIPIFLILYTILGTHTLLQHAPRQVGTQSLSPFLSLSLSLSLSHTHPHIQTKSLPIKHNLHLLASIFKNLNSFLLKLFSAFGHFFFVFDHLHVMEIQSLVENLFKFLIRCNHIDRALLSALFFSEFRKTFLKVLISAINNLFNEVSNLL